MNLTKSISASASTTFSGAVTKSAISSAVGFSITSSTSVSYTGSYTVPSNAKKATLTAYPLYNKYSYGIYLRGKGSLPDTLMTTGIALKPIGIYYSKSVTY